MVEHFIHHISRFCFVGIGDVVKKGQNFLCILEAMKIMNEVEAEFDCKIS